MSDLEEYQDIVDYSIRIMYRRFNKNLIDYLKEDLVQEAYIKLLESVPGWSEATGVPLRKYLLYCTIRAVAHVVKREQLYQHNYGNPIEPLIPQLFDSRISSSLIAEYMAHLTEKEREVLDKIIQGDNISEIAEGLGVRKQTVVDAVGSLRTKLNTLEY